MGQVFARRKGQRVQIGDSIVVVKKVERRWVELYVEAPREISVRGLDVEVPPDQAAGAAEPPMKRFVMRSRRRRTSPYDSLAPRSEQDRSVNNDQRDQQPQNQAEADSMDQHAEAERRRDTAHDEVAEWIVDPVLRYRQVERSRGDAETRQR
jgi:hypothetical protein